jgi:hypothetical protein
MSLDLDGLALIDTMLDCIVELRLMPNVWTESETKYLGNLHTALIRLNRYWETLEIEEAGGMEIMSLRNILSSVVGYTELLSFGFKDRGRPEITRPLQCLERLGKLFYAKVDYLNSRVRREY